MSLVICLLVFSGHAVEGVGHYAFLSGSGYLGSYGEACKRGLLLWGFCGCVFFEGTPNGVGF